ncbi:MAG: hypothetical protein METHAR1v1_520010 [Methanothrix sp.]|jgi:hypothetical protein|nr:MAG: hypothetical protein METHAR1v1_520010 [Methanothrix sp.]
MYDNPGEIKTSTAWGSSADILARGEETPGAPLRRKAPYKADPNSLKEIFMPIPSTPVEM